MTLYHGASIITDSLTMLVDAVNPLSYPGSGSAWNDLSGRGNNCTLTVAPTYSSTANLGAFLFNGTSTYIYTPSFGTSLNTTFTYEVWFNSSAANGVILSEQGQLTLNSGWFDSNIEIVANSLKLGFWTGSAEASLTLQTISTGVWYMVSMTYVGTTLTGYVNGVLANSASFTKGNPGTTYLPLGAGCGTNLGSGAYYSGYIGTFKIYNQALSAAQILQNFNAYRGRYGV